MKTCEHCPFPKRCIPADRCIAYKIGAVSYEAPAPKPMEVNTTFGVGSTGTAPSKSSGKAKKVKKK